MANTVASKEWRTFKEWSAAGYKINKGSKASWHSGTAQFSREQVTYSPPRSTGYHWIGTGIKGMDGGDLQYEDQYDHDGPDGYDLILGWHK